MGICNCSMFCCTLLCVRSGIAIILMEKRELVALLILSSWCLAMVRRLFLAMPRGFLRFVIVVLPDHTHLLFFIRIWLEIMSLKSDQLELGFSLSKQKVQRSQITMLPYETFYWGFDYLPKYPLL